MDHLRVPPRNVGPIDQPLVIKEEPDTKIDEEFPDLYTPDQVKETQDIIDQYAIPANRCIQVTASANNADQVAYYYDSITTMAEEYAKLRPHLPEHTWLQTTFRLRHILDQLDDLRHRVNAQVNVPPQFAHQWVKSENNGRKLEVDIELLRTLTNQGFTDREMAEDWFKVSRRTIIRRRQDAQIKKRDWSMLSDDELLEAIQMVLHMGSGLEGEKGVHSGLKVLGIKVTQERLRAALRQFHNRPHKERRAIIRRVYRVPFINSLWHIDGHHKLGPWGIVIHGAIDGFSRRIMYMVVADNNRASTVGQAFEKAVAEYGWPSRVRADFGKENWEVKQKMEKTRGLDRGSFIQGSSTHNQRIERLWVDLQAWATSRYRQQFIYYEEKGYLSQDDPLAMWALHFVYLPTLRNVVDFFVARWNNHAISTESSRTPEQLWIRSVQSARDLGLNPMQYTEDLDQSFEDVNGQHPLQEGLTFADYGVDHFKGRASHQPQDDDPHRKVPSILKHLHKDVRDYIQSDDFRLQIQEIAGDDRWTWPPPQDFGEDRYLTVVGAVRHFVSVKFPNMCH